MALLSEVGTLLSPSSTGTQAISLTSFGGETPKAIIIWTSQGVSNGIATDALFGIGAATSTSNRSSVATNQEDAGVSFDEDRRHDATAAIIALTASGAVNERADLSSFAADEFTLNWTVVDGSATRRYHWIALGGSTFEANLISLVAPVSTGNQTYAHGLGGAPTALLAFSAHNITAPPSSDGAAEAGMTIGGSDITNDVWSGVYISNSSGGSTRAQDSNFLSHSQPVTIVEAATVDSVDGTNITLNWSLADTAEYYYVLAMRGVVAEAGTYTSPASTGTKTVTTAITPKVFFTWGVMDVASSTVEDDARLTFGASNGAGDASAGLLNTNTDGDRFSHNSAVLQVYDHSQSLQESANVLSLSGNDVNLNFTSAVAALNEFNYLAMGDAAGGAISINVEVVAWKAEVDDGNPPANAPVIYFAGS